MDKLVRNGWASAFVAAAFGSALASGTAFAQQVEIKTMAGGVAVSGELVDFDDEFLTVRAQMGTIRISRSMSICEGEGCPPDAQEQTALLDPGSLAITGSASIGAALLPRMVGGFAQDQAMAIEVDFDNSNRNLVMRLKETGGDAKEINLKLDSTARAFDDLLKGRASIILTSRRASASEAQRFVEAGIGDIRNERNEAVIALDGLGIVVSPENDISALAIEDVVGIVAGEIVDWSEVGGPRRPIALHLPPSGEDAFEAFAEDVLRPRRLRPSRQAIRSRAGDELAAAVAADPNAIGLVPLSQSGEAQVLSLELSCGLLAESSAFAVKAEEYPFGRRIYLYHRNPGVNVFADDLFAYTQSDSGQSGVGEVGFYDQTIIRRSVNEQGLRFVSAIVSDQGGSQLGQLQEMAAKVLQSTRLSTTLRFNSGSTTLDTKALSDVQRMAAELTAPGAEYREVLLLGFTDGVGRSDVNQIISEDRAKAVRDQLVAAIGPGQGGLNIQAIGYGPVAPVGCNDEIGGREANRRVEVWVR